MVWGLCVYLQRRASLIGSQGLFLFLNQWVLLLSLDKHWALIPRLNCKYSRPSNGRVLITRMPNCNPGGVLLCRAFKVGPKRAGYLKSDKCARPSAKSRLAEHDLGQHERYGQTAWRGLSSTCKKSAAWLHFEDIFSNSFNVNVWKLFKTHILPRHWTSLNFLNL